VKKFIFLAMLLGCFIPQTALATSQVSYFSDVPEEYEWSKQINWLAQEGVISGYEDGTFKPTNTITRAELLKMLFEVIGMTEDLSQVTLPFTDVAADAWYINYVKEAYARGIISGYEDNTFRPDNYISIKDSIKVVVKGFYNVDNTTASITPKADCHLMLEQFFKQYEPLNSFCEIPLWALNASDENGNLTRGLMGKLLYTAKVVQDNSCEAWLDLLKPNPILNWDIHGVYGGFAIGLPNGWVGYKVSEQNTSYGPFTAETINIGFGEDNVLFSIHIFPESTWNSLQQEVGITIPTLLFEKELENNDVYVFAYSITNTCVDPNNCTLLNNDIDFILDRILPFNPNT